MNPSPRQCTRCGATLSGTTTDDSCKKCLLEVGLASGTDFSIGGLAETLPHDDGAKLVRAKDSDHLSPAKRGSGIERYQDLTAVHDWSGGTIYRAFHDGLQRFVLLRVLESSADDEARREFLSRAEKLSHLNHANTAATLEAGVDRGAAFVAEEWVEGSPVDGFRPRNRRQRWAEGFFPNDELISVMRDAASGLNAIHQTGVTHDRINPDSIVMDTGGVVRLVGLGEASESSDDRFSSLPNDDSGSQQSDRSVAADLFRFGATFCFLTTGQLPATLDPTLSASLLTLRIKTINPGLRNDLCEVIAKCCSRPLDSPGQPNQSNDVALSLELTRRGDNPYQSAHANDSSGFRSANEIVSELNRLLRSGASRVSWRSRFYSGYLEAFCCLFIAGLTYSLLMRQDNNNGKEIPISLASSIYLLPILYAVVFETLFGWTLIRRLFGMRLLNHAGERARWWRQMGRAVQKSVLLLFLIALPAIVTPLLAMQDVSPMITMIMLPIGSLFLPALGMYLPARWIPSRWTTYDLAAGVTWGEETHAALPAPTDLTQATTKSRSALPTGRIDQYDLYEPLGSGGMGHVFRGRDSVLGRPVAIKLLSGSLVRNPLLLERFQREARLAAKVNHPGVAKVFGNGVWDETPYIAMELVPGNNLQEVIKQQGRLPLATAWDYVTQAAEALRAADRSGVVHRDVKPANLMVTEGGRLKVTDFGVSRGVTVDDGVTEHGTIVGTPAYMAPEQAMGKEVDCRCDIYALGMTLYHMLSGHAPFKADSAVEMLAQQMSESPPSLFGEVSGMTLDQAAVLERMIAKKPAERYANYDELLDDLNRHSPGIDRLASPLKRIAAEACNVVTAYLMFMLAILATFLFALQSSRGPQAATWFFGGLLVLLYLTCAGVYIIGVGRQGVTPGKRLLSLRVVRASGQPVGYARAALRLTVAYPLPVIFIPRLLHYVITSSPGMPMEKLVIDGLAVAQLLSFVVSIVMMWIRADRKTLHDLAAGTLVVRDRK